MSIVKVNRHKIEGTKGELENDIFNPHHKLRVAKILF